MNSAARTAVILVSILVLFVLDLNLGFGNGGPFVIKYPNGDPAAKGVLARLDPDLKPGRESRLRVVKEDLKVTFGRDWFPKSTAVEPPLARVSAEYTIENPTNKDIEIDFGFPILRGIYINPIAMTARPHVQVRLGDKAIMWTMISNSAIYGIIRQRAGEVIEQAVAIEPKLNKLVVSVRQARNGARQALLSYLADTMGWNERDAALMLEYASLDVATTRSHPPDRVPGWWGQDKTLNEVINSNLGPLAAIGEQKATQFFAHLASCFDPAAGAAYEAIFAAWGGDVREQSVDMKTGKVRPREITVDNDALNKPWHQGTDLTIYARVDYLDPQAKITESEKASCEAILKNLPVIFTFAPMNILHYQVTFPANSIQKLVVSYGQIAYADTGRPKSYQLAYVVHPASLWNDFGPINLEVAVPQGVPFGASVVCSKTGLEARQINAPRPQGERFDIYRTVLTKKTGELYLAVDAEAWKKFDRRALASNSADRVQQIAQQTKQKVRQ